MSSPNIKISKKLENGIEFSCKMCGECCRGFDEGEVYLYKEDIFRLTNYLNIKGINGLKDFAKAYLKVIDESFYWRDSDATRGKTYRFKTLGFKFTGKDEYCHFLVNNKCSVHEARPFQCRCFPFWKLMVSSRKNFINYTKKCQGLQELKGRYYSKNEILEWSKKEYEIEKNYFLEMKQHNFNILKIYPFLHEEMIK